MEDKDKKEVKKTEVKSKDPVKTKKTETKSPAKKAKAVSPKKTKVKSDKFAVIFTGGKQYLVQEGDVLKIEKIIDLKEGAEIVFDKVLLVADGDNVKIGTEFVAGAKVTAKSVGNIRDKKITVLKYKRKTRYCVKRGHRQTHTEVVVTSIK